MLSCAILTLRQETGCSAFVKVEFILSHDVSLSEQPTIFLMGPLFVQNHSRSQSVF